MGIQRATLALATLTVAAGALAACAPPPPGPEPPTPEQIAAVRHEQAQSWWDSLSTGTTMPDVDVIAALPLEKASVQQTECLAAADLPGVRVYGPGAWEFDAAAVDEDAAIATQVQWWTCAQQYPVENDFEWMRSPSQLAWLYDFYGKRYLPCIRSLGIEPLDFPTRDEFLGADLLGGNGGFPAWLPYEQTVRPIPTTDEWKQLAQRCPLPDMVHDYGLPGYID